MRYIDLETRIVGGESSLCWKLVPFKICILDSPNCIGIDENGKVRLLKENKENDDLNDSLMWSLSADGQLLSNQIDGQCLQIDFSGHVGFVNMVDCAVVRINQHEGFILDIPVIYRRLGDTFELDWGNKRRKWAIEIWWRYFGDSKTLKCYKNK